MSYKKPLLIYLFVIISKIILSESYAGSLDYYGKIDEAYDDNVTYTRVNKKQDYITMFSLGFKALFENKKDSFTMKGNASQQIFKNNYKFNNISQDIELSYQKEFTKFTRIKLNDIFYHIYEPRNYEDEFSRTTGRYSTNKNKFNLVYSLDIKRELTILVKYMNGTINNSRQDLKDSYLNSYGLGGEYRLDPYTIFNISSDLLKREFYSGEHSLTYSSAFGVRKYTNRSFYFDGKAGYDLITPYSGDKLKKSLWALSFTNEIDKNKKTTISYIKQYTASSYIPDIYDLWKISGDFNLKLSEKMNFDFLTYYGKTKYLIMGNVNENTGANIGFNYEMKNNLKGNISYSYSGVESDNIASEYARNRISFAMNARF